MTLKEQARKLKQDAPAVFLAYKDRDTPLLAKILAGVTVAYALSPIDLIPDFVPVLGYLDDVLLLPALIALTVKLIPNSMTFSYRYGVSSGITPIIRPSKLRIPVLQCSDTHTP